MKKKKSDNNKTATTYIHYLSQKITKLTMIPGNLPRNLVLKHSLRPFCGVLQPLTDAEAYQDQVLVLLCPNCD